MLVDLPKAVKHNDMIGQVERSNPDGRKGSLRFFDIIYYLLCLAIAASSIAILCSKIASGESICLLEKGSYVVNSDYPMFYYGGKLASSFGKQDLYDIETQLNVINAAVAPLHLKTVPLLPYPPHLYMIMALPAQLPIHSSFAVWVTFTALLSIFCVFKLCQANEQISLREKIAYSISLLAIFPMYFLLVSGQASALWLLFMTLFYLANSKRSELLAACSIALMAIKPHYALVLSTIPISLGRWRQLLFACGMLALALLLPCFVWGFDVWSDYLAYVQIWSANADGSIHAERQASVRWLISMAPTSMQIILNSIALGTCLLVIGFICWRSRRHERLFPLAFTSSITTMQFLFPYMHMYDAIIVWGAMAVSIKTYSPSTLIALEDSAAKLFHAVIMLYPLIGLLGFVLLPEFGTKFNIPFVFANAVLFVSSIIWFCNELRKADAISLASQ